MILWCVTVRVSIVFDAHTMGMLHVIHKPRHENLPALVNFAIQTGSQIPGIDVPLLGNSHDRLQHSVGDMSLHLPVYIPLGSVIGSVIPLKREWHREEGNDNVHEMAPFVPYTAMGSPNNQVDRPEFLWPEMSVSYILSKSQISRTVVAPVGYLSCVSHHQSAECISEQPHLPLTAMIHFWI